MLFWRGERWVENKLENAFKSFGAPYCTGLIWDQATRVCREKSMALFQGWLIPLLDLSGGTDSECLLDFESLYFLCTLRLIFFEAGLYLGSVGTFEK